MLQLALFLALLTSSNTGAQSSPRAEEPGVRQAVPAPAAKTEEATLESALEDLKNAVAKLQKVRAATLQPKPEDLALLVDIQRVSSTLDREVRALRVMASPPIEKPAPTPEAVAYERSKPWVEEIRALGPDAARRRELALGEVRLALQGGDAIAQHAALMALQSCGDVEYDKHPFRDLVLPFAQTAKGPPLRAAMYALFNTESAPADLALVHAAWERDRQGLDSSVLHLMHLFGGGAITGRSEDIALEYIADFEKGESRQGVNGMWGAKVGPRLEARMLELERSPDREVRHDAIYFGLSTFADKGPAVVDALIRILTDPDHNNSGRALWGLSHGVLDSEKAKVVDALVDLHNARADPQVRASCRRTIEMYGGPAALNRLAK